MSNSYFQTIFCLFYIFIRFLIFFDSISISKSFKGIYFLSLSTNSDMV